MISRHYWLDNHDNTLNGNLISPAKVTLGTVGDDVTGQLHKTRHSPNIVSMLGQRLCHWHNDQTLLDEWRLDRTHP